MAKTPQNSGSTTVDIETMLPSAPAKADCGELTTRNDDQQKKKTKRRKPIKRGQTSVTAHHQPAGGNPVFAGAVTPQSAVASSASNSLCQAPPQKVLKGKGKGGKNKLSPPPNRPCTDTPFKFRRKGHGEAKILQTLAANDMLKPGSTLTLNIDWKPTKGPASDSPCPDCEKMLCDAIKKCKVTIMICRKGQSEPENFEDQC
jgi:hypothetical protein